MPTLSVVVPVYNNEKYIRECIESILSQSFEDIEIILVDDGSSDGSLDICKEYKDEGRVNIIENGHKGPFYARKAGVSKAKGEYITFVDSDDFIDKVSYALAKEDMYKGIDIISFDIYRYYSDESITYSRSWPEEGIYEKGEIEREIYPVFIWNQKNKNFGLDTSLCNKIIKASILKTVYRQIGTADYHYGEDMTILYPSVMMACSISMHNKSYYYHRRHKDSYSYFFSDDYMENLFKLFKCLKENLPSEEIFVKQIELFYSHAVGYRKKKYKIPVDTEDIIFPFDKVEKGEKVVVYGAGDVGKVYMNQLSQLDYCDVVLWVDKSERDDDRIASPERIYDICYDKIVIAIANKDICKELKNQFIENHIEQEKIVW